MFGLPNKSNRFKVIAISLLALCLFSCDDDLAEGVDIAYIPAYYFENNYLDERANAINDAIVECSGGCETFFWITDIHWEPDLNTRKAPLLIKYLSSKTGINKILNGGDTGNSQVICKNAITQLRNAIGSNAVYSVNGNHEMNDASRYERPYRRVAQELRGHCSDIIYGNNDKSYFYFDKNETRTRYIGLASYGLFLNNKYQSCYTAEQLDWFRNRALNVSEGWSIVIFTHSLYHVDGLSGKLVKGGAGASDIIAAIDEYHGNGTIISVLMGHSHKDRIHIGNTGVPYIISACDRSSPYNNDINVTRVPGTINEQHFEVVVIDKEKRQVKLFSIGGNARDGFDDDPGAEVDIRTVFY